VRILEAINQVDLKTGGPSRAVLDLSLAMAERGHTVTVVTRSGPDLPREWQGPIPAESSQPRGVALPQSRWLAPGSEAVATLLRLVADSDVVHLHGVWEPFNLRLAAIARAARVPYVVTLRGMLDDWCMAQRGLKKRIYLAAVGQRFLERAALVQCTAEAELYQSEKWFPRGRGVVLPNLLDLRPYESLAGPDAAIRRFPFLADQQPWLLFLGRVTPKKGVGHLIEAARVLRVSGCPVGVVVAGAADSPAYLAELQDRVVSAGLADHVRFVGHVDGGLKVSLLQAVDLTVIPTSQENFGFVFYESLAAGTPVVTTPLIDTAGELQRSGACYLVEQDGGMLADGLQTLLADRDRLRCNGHQAREWIFREYATPRIAARYEAMFRVAVACSPAGRARSR
jgi:glycosyltransferase involved in cell wall biosynthesis